MTNSTSYYEVERGITRLVTKTVEYEVSTKEFAALLATPRDNHLLFLPDQCRAVFAEGATGRVSFLIEQPPRVRLLEWPANARRREGQNSFELAIPWCYMVFTAGRVEPDDPNSTLTYTGMNVYAAPHRIETLDDKTLTGMPVNNVQQDGRICFGTAAAAPGVNLGEHINNLTNSFWNSLFNYDITPTLPGYRDYKQWEEDTKQDPACWMKWPWNDQQKWLHPTYDLSGLVNVTADRLTPAILPDPIPNLPLTPTFGLANEWAAALTPQQRTTLLAALTPRT